MAPSPFCTSFRALKLAVATMTQHPICGRLGCIEDADRRVAVPGKGVRTTCDDCGDGHVVIEVA